MTDLELDIASLKVLGLSIRQQPSKKMGTSYTQHYKTRTTGNGKDSLDQEPGSSMLRDINDKGRDSPFANSHNSGNRSPMIGNLQKRSIWPFSLEKGNRDTLKTHS